VADGLGDGAVAFAAMIRTAENLLARGLQPHQLSVKIMHGLHELPASSDRTTSTNASQKYAPTSTRQRRFRCERCFRH
jgi:hypothetical protein